jgi:three-Cys-motif partner protein
MGINRNEAQFARYRDWQWIKHLVFSDYTIPWAAKVGSTSRSIFIADVCAGKGTYTDAATKERFDGSPVIFARRAREYMTQHPDRRMHVICVEKNRNNFEALQQCVSGFENEVILKHGDFGRYTDYICETVGDNPALMVIDPIGLKAIPACARLIHRNGKTDLFMILHFKVVHRTAGQLLATAHADPKIKGAVKASETIDAALGSPRWRWKALDPSLSVEQKERAFLDLFYEDVLRDRYTRKCAYGVRAREGSEVQYWLMHASDHLDAFLLMNDEMVKLDRLQHIFTYGDGALPDLVEQEWDDRYAARLTALEKRIMAFVSAEPGRMTTFGRIRDEMLKGFFGLVKQGAHSNAVKSLVRGDRLLREQRAAAKLEPGERIWLPPSPVRVPVGVAACAA